MLKIDYKQVYNHKKSLKKIMKKKVTFAPNVKPYERKLPHIKAEKKLWNWFLDDQPWAQPVDYYISENYSKTNKHTRLHIFKIIENKMGIFIRRRKIALYTQSRI